MSKAVTTVNEKLAALPVVRRERIEKRAAELIAEEVSLRNLHRAMTRRRRLKGRREDAPNQYVGTCIDIPTYCNMAVMTRGPAMEIVKRMGIVRPIDLEARGISRSELYRLLREGSVERQGRGLYVASRHAYTEQHSLAQVAKRVSAGVICLLSALRFHGLTTQSPADVWVALPIRARKPSIEYPRLRVARFSGAAFSEGVEKHRLEGVEVQIYSAAKTVADCFKYRNKIGIDVAVEALRDFTRTHRGGGNDLARFARICRVARVMQPYLDSIA